jgi:PPP family 3-phenylpropionic acid transporter
VRTAIALRVYYFFCFAALGIYLPFFPRWLEARGIGGWAMGAVAAAFPAMGIVAPPLFGWIADGLGLRRSLLQVASGGALAAVAGLGAIALYREPALALILAAFALLAFFRAPMVMMADVVTIEGSGVGARSYGTVRLWGSLGFLISAVACGRVLDLTLATVLPLAMSVCLALAFATSFVLPARSETPRGPLPEHVRALVRAPEVRRFLVASFFAQAAHSGYDLLFSLHLRDLGVSAAGVGLAWAIGVLAEVALMALSMRLPLGRPELVLPIAFAGAACRWLLIALAPQPWLLLALQPLHAISFALMWLASLSFLRLRAAPQVLASAQGIFTATMGAASALGMLGWGATYRAWGGANAFVVAAVLAACAALTVGARRPPRGPGRLGRNSGQPA